MRCCVAAELLLEIRGTDKQRDDAKFCTQIILEQRHGVVAFEQERSRGDVSVIEVPGNSVGYVTGKGGARLHKMEDDWRIFMFFAKRDRHSQGAHGETQKLVFFGNE